MTAGTVLAPEVATLEPQRRAGRGFGTRKHWEPFIIGSVSVLCMLAAWQLATTVGGLSPLTLPSPHTVYDSFHTYVSSGAIWPDLKYSSQELALGYGFAVVLGVSVGLIAGWYRLVAMALAPYLWFVLSVPIISITPLVLIWAGLGLKSAAIIVFLPSFFQILINTMMGVRTIDPALTRTSYAYCASSLQTFRTVALPGAVPSILVGMRLGVAHAVVGLYVAELSGAQHGVGYMMNVAGETFQTSRVFVGLIIFGVGGSMLSGILRIIEIRLRSWAPDNSRH